MRSLVICYLMKILLLILSISSISCTTKWTREDTYFESALVAISIIDFKQTMDIVDKRYEGSDQFTTRQHNESNPLMRNHPHHSEVYQMFAGGLILHCLIAEALPEGWRRSWQLLWIGIEANAVNTNFNCGINVTF